MKCLLYVCLAALVGCGTKYSVGDYYEVEGVRGVVFSVTDGGRHGKILSLDETSLPWQTGRGINVVGAADQADGAANLEVIKSQPDWQERFPAFAWCVEQGEGWYLPAVNEMAEINASHEAVNAALVAAQATPLETQGGDLPLLVVDRDGQVWGQRRLALLQGVRAQRGNQELFAARPCRAGLLAR